MRPGAEYNSTPWAEVAQSVVFLGIQHQEQQDLTSRMKQGRKHCTTSRAAWCLTNLNGGSPVQSSIRSSQADGLSICCVVMHNFAIALPFLRVFTHLVQSSGIALQTGVRMRAKSSCAGLKLTSRDCARERHCWLEFIGKWSSAAPFCANRTPGMPAVGIWSFLPWSILAACMFESSRMTLL